MDNSVFWYYTVELSWGNYDVNVEAQKTFVSVQYVRESIKILSHPLAIAAYRQRQEEDTEDYSDVFQIWRAAFIITLSQCMITEA